MKLTNIRLYNAGNFSVANLGLDASSIQLAGRNNKGKTSLLWTLMMLFVVHRKRATHPDYGEKQSLQFYFKSDKSYIIFEGFDEKEGYYYVLLHRNGSDIDYYFAKNKFREEFIIKDGSILSFDKVMENPGTGMKTKDSSVSETLARNVSSKRGELGFLRTVSGVSSIRFSELYRHLFRADKNDNNILKTGILVVSGHRDEKIDFGSEVGQEERVKWKREQKEISELKSIKGNLDLLKDSRDKCETARVALLSEIVKYDDIEFEYVLQKIKGESKEFNDKIGTYRKTIDTEIYNNKENAKTRHQTATQAVGSANALHDAAKEKLDKASSYGEETWAKQQVVNAEEKARGLKALIDKIEQDGDADRVAKKLANAKTKKLQIENYLNKESELLILNIFDDKDDIAKANAVLSDEVKNLPKECVQKGSGEIGDALTLNSAKIDISSITPLPLPTKEEKSIELKEVTAEIKMLSNVLEKIQEKDALVKEHQDASENEYEEKRKYIEIKNIPEYKKNTAELNTLLKEKVDIQVAIAKKMTDLEEKEKELSKSIESLEARVNRNNKEEGAIFELSLELSTASRLIERTREESAYREISSENAYKKCLTGISTLKETQDAFREKEADYDNFVDHLKRLNKSLEGIEHDTNDQLISILEEKCYGIEIREKEFGNMLKTGFHLFFQRIQRFLNELDAVTSEVSKINRIISKYTISDLSNVRVNIILSDKLVNTLRGINSDNIDLFSSVDTMESDLSEGKDSLTEWMRVGKVIYLADLFSIEIEREKNNKKVKSQQSNGTERMLHVMLLLILMREMIVPEDTIPFLIDEVADIDTSNQAELLSFFKELNLLPISASPESSSEFDKIYRIEEINGSSYLSNDTSTWKEAEGVENA